MFVVYFHADLGEGYYTEFHRLVIVNKLSFGWNAFSWNSACMESPSDSIWIVPGTNPEGE